GAGGGSASSSSVLSNGDIVQGLKQALLQGSQKAVGQLGQTDGFLGNPKVRIPMPASLQKVESTLRMLKQDKYADEFVQTMNRAAEQAVPKAVDMFKAAISQMTVADAKNILGGPSDAATQYFRRVGGPKLTQDFRPIVENATSQAGLTSSYKQLMNKGGGVLTQLMGKEATDLDGYVTEKAVDGLFTLIAEEERLIRENPVARTTDILKKVFGN
ncbi:MAG: DUF4197 domain-containing protein, partial [Gammaproteobacteria bacterium]|nr:DUF4197 domain-containing protein [Gammaproteobacteria bacterium]